MKKAIVRLSQLVAGNIVMLDLVFAFCVFTCFFKMHLFVLYVCYLIAVLYINAYILNIVVIN